ncbi:sodium-dependent phosphate transport protein 1, chloroplastic isoform X1 [Amborella trichopoda]|uniref:sodium-dependent phosphate transport protein 1, chloroplastic isoform X1 n=1 Tax=Amborella trichopoda TaxID=13333 RepID=UPI0009BD4AA3|nr:sodium-dependent phosphate transport protein 1, chloroplastic isoform X1 [Amborella trichopoda]|eukprot:XP_020525105.1 sodium-dependent phosphate transport protein 1, chloroplastic isoform X1 [Amborella trichopoda]
MAVSPRQSFGCFLVSGQGRQSERAMPHFKGDYTSFCKERSWGVGKCFCIASNQMKGGYYLSFPIIGYSSCIFIRCSIKRERRPGPIFSQPKDFAAVKYECLLSSKTWGTGVIQSRLRKLGSSNGFCHESQANQLIKTRADLKSKPYDIIESKSDSVKFFKVLSEVVLSEEDTQDKSPWWEQFPKRWVIVLLCSSAFLLCNMDRVNMSIAILPMSAEFNWSPSTVGLIQSSFFWGYLLTQIAGGIWADTVGGKLVLGFGVVWWSIATVLTPVAAKLGLPFLLVMRAFMGIGEGVAMPAMNNILSKWIPVKERSRSLALVYSGMYLGSVTGLAFSPLLIQKFGWPSVFYSFGSLGTVWVAIWLNKAYSSPQEDPQLCEDEKKLIVGDSVSKQLTTTIPWRLILSKPPVWALIISHFCHNWGTFILLTWMPTYYNQVLKFNLTESGLLCVLPWLTMAVSANIGGWIADSLVSKGFSITTVRKIMQSIGFLGPAFFLTQLSHVHSPAMAVLCMACSQGTDAFSQSGLYSNHQDIGPRYAGVLLGLSNTAGVLAGVFGTAATGYILQHGSWDDLSLSYLGADCVHGKFRLSCVLLLMCSWKNSGFLVSCF